MPSVPDERPGEGRRRAAAGSASRSAPGPVEVSPPRRGVAGPASGGTIASAIAVHFREPYRSLANILIPSVVLTFYKYQPEIESWFVATIKDIHARHKARGSCRGIRRLIKDNKSRIKEPDLDPGTREELAAERTGLEKMLTEANHIARLGKP